MTGEGAVVVCQAEWECDAVERGREGLKGQAKLEEGRVRLQAERAVLGLPLIID